MRRTCSLLLLCMAAALTFGTTTASAEGVQVTEEATGNPCPAITPNDSREFPLESTISGGCSEHIVNTEGGVILTAHIFGIESTDSQCNTEYTLRVGGNGEGYFTDIELTGINCTRRACGTADGAPEGWEIHMEETSSSSARLERHFCIENYDGNGRTTCHYFAPLREDPIASHRYELGTANSNEARTEIGCEGFTGYRGEVSGHWKTETSALELVHSP